MAITPNSTIINRRLLLLMFLSIGSFLTFNTLTSAPKQAIMPDQLLNELIEQPLANQQEDSKKTRRTPYYYVAQELLKNFTAQNNPEQGFKNRERTPMSPYHQHAIALQILDKAAQDKLTTPDKILDPTTIQDLQLFFYDKTKPDFTLLNTIKRTETVLGTCVLARMLITPTTQVSELKRRQRIIQLLASNEKLFNHLKTIVQAFKKEEPYLLSLWNNEDIIYGKNIRDTFYGGSLDWKNGYLKSSTQLELATRKKDFLMIAIPVISFFLPDIVKPLAQKLVLNTEIERFDKNASFAKKYKGNIIALILTSLLSVPHTYSGFVNRIQIIRHLRMRFKSLVLYADTLRNIASSVTKTPDLEILLKEYGPIRNFLHAHDETQRTFIKHLGKRAFTTNSYLLANIGTVLDALPKFLRLRDSFGDSLEAIGQLDAYLSLAQLYKEHRSRPAQYSFARYVKYAEHPIIDLHQFWHPMIDPYKVVKNSVNLGVTNKDMLITGPNAAGKSTVVKAITLSALMAQTIGLVPAQFGLITPLTQIITHLNVVDDITSGDSMFASEVKRADELLSVVKQLEPDQFALLVMDEMFNSVTPLEGEAGALGFAQKLSGYPNVMVSFVTHFPKLKTLPERTNNNFANYKVVVNRGPNGEIINTFTLQNGASDQVIALDLIEQEGVAPELSRIAARFHKNHR